MRKLRTFVKHFPRIACAIAFGIGTAALVYFSWIPDSRGQSQIIPLAIGAGITHALAGSLTGPRIVFPGRTPRLLHASLWGAGTSLLALMLFSFAMTGQIYHPQFGDSHPLALFFLTFVFAYLGAGWALMLLCVGISCGLCQLASHENGSSL